MADAPEWAARMGSAARDYVMAHHTWTQAAARAEQVYAGLARPRGAAVQVEEVKGAVASARRQRRSAPAAGLQARIDPTGATAARRVLAGPWRVSLTLVIWGLLVLLCVEAFLYFHRLSFHLHKLPHAAQLPM